MHFRPPLGFESINTDLDYGPPIALPLYQEDALHISIRVLNLETYLSEKKRGGDPKIASSANKAKEQVMADHESASPAKKIKLQTTQMQLMGASSHLSPQIATCNFQTMWLLNDERHSTDKLNFIVSVSHPHRNSSR
ncbi:hypothetical protein QYF36_012674 [Acer negundo]|nr:hypothetical protein QYF36_012674 [Acer negundo]